MFVVEEFVHEGSSSRIRQRHVRVSVNSVSTLIDCVNSVLVLIDCMLCHVFTRSKSKSTRRLQIISSVLFKIPITAKTSLTLCLGRVHAIPCGGSVHPLAACTRGLVHVLKDPRLICKSFPAVREKQKFLQPTDLSPCFRHGCGKDVGS